MFVGRQISRSKRHTGEACHEMLSMQDLEISWRSHETKPFSAYRYDDNSFAWSRYLFLRLRFRLIEDLFEHDDFLRDLLR
jgi:hypothetical protein